MQQGSVRDVEIIEAQVTVDMGEIEMDYGDDGRDEYDQLQLALAAG